jgi:hypothetical protein
MLDAGVATSFGVGTAVVDALLLVGWAWSAIEGTLVHGEAAVAAAVAVLGITGLVYTWRRP